MFKTLIGKFTFFFWLLFLLVTIPIYIFGNFHFKNILKDSEEEKITLTLNTLKPIIALNLSFNQQEQLHKILDGLFEHKDIQTIKLTSPQEIELYFKARQKDKLEKVIQYKSTILDPFSKTIIATITLDYSNIHILQFNNKIFMILLLTFIFALMIFSISFYYIAGDLKALRLIANSLRQYSMSKDMELIVQSSKSREINTIASVANQMVTNIAQYVQQLESFNLKLEQRVKEEILKQKNQESMMIHQSRQAAMGEMIESIAHQWRQPLNIIGSATVNLETEYTLGLMDEKKFHNIMEIISLNINYMSDTIDDFRNFLNPTKETNDFDPKKCIQAVLTILDVQLHNNKIIHTIKCDNDMLFHGIENEFKQVLFILFSNTQDAIKMQIEKKYIEKGEINISLSSQNNQGIIKISDNGGGIDTDKIDSIFEPYFTTKAHAKGTGIGLYIAKNIIQNRMKGSLSVKNTEFGCCFTIAIPLTKETNI